MILGETSVGKTNLLLRYTNDEFTSHTPTIGLDFSSKAVYVDGKSVKIQFWDTAGQEKYRAMAKNYYKMANGVILVYDITRAETFKKLDTWVNEIRTHANSKTKIMLISNKNDLAKERVVSREEGESFAKKNGMFFWETSALTNDGKCVNKAFDTIFQECIRDVYKQYKINEAVEYEIIKKQTKVLKNDAFEERKACCW